MCVCVCVCSSAHIWNKTDDSGDDNDAAVHEVYIRSTWKYYTAY